MQKIGIKRVYEPAEPSDGYRVLVDKLWPRGMSKERLHYDLWAKELAPSAPLRAWFHAAPEKRWDAFRERYIEELERSPAVQEFAEKTRGEKILTLLYTSRNAAANHARIMRDYLSHLPD